MKPKTREDYAKKMQRRTPAPKKGKSRKDHAAVEKESNAALVKKNEWLVNESNRVVGAMEYTIAVLDAALKTACQETRHPAEWYVKKAEEEIEARE